MSFCNLFVVYIFDLYQKNKANQHFFFELFANTEKSS